MKIDKKIIEKSKEFKVYLKQKEYFINKFNNKELTNLDLINLIIEERIMRFETYRKYVEQRKKRINLSKKLNKINATIN